MRWKDLQKEAEKILANKPTGEFQDKSFIIHNAASIVNDAGVPIVHKSFIPTRRVGQDWKGDAEIVVRCRETGRRDRDGDKIYEAEDGTLFIYIRYPGNPSSFAYGVLREPIFSAQK